MKKLAAVTFVGIGVDVSAHVVLSADSVPQVQSSSYFGNYASDESTDAAVDGRGFVYVVGVSELFGGNADAFVLKLTPDGSQVLYTPRTSVAAASTSRTRWPSTPRARSTWPGTRHQPTFLSFSRFSRVSAARRTRGSRSSILPDRSSTRPITVDRHSKTGTPSRSVRAARCTSRAGPDRPICLA